MKIPSLQIADVAPADPRVSSEYINAKYKAWLQRRGLTDPAFAAEYERATQRRGFSFSKKKGKK